VNHCRGHTRVLRLFEVLIRYVDDKSSASARTINETLSTA
jgi:hypothetical protein